MSDYTEKNSNLIPQIDIPCFAWNSQAEQGFLFFKAKSLPLCLDHHRQLLKIMSMNHYDLEENSRMEMYDLTFVAARRMLRN